MKKAESKITKFEFECVVIVEAMNYIYTEHVYLRSAFDLE